MSMVFWSPRRRSTSRRRSLWTTVGETLGTQFTWLVVGALFNLTGLPCKFRPRWGPGVTMSIAIVMVIKVAIPSARTMVATMAEPNGNEMNDMAFSLD